MRVAASEGIGQFHHIEQLFQALFFLLACQPEIEFKRPAQNIPDALTRVEGGVRHLVDKLDFLQLLAWTTAQITIHL